MADDKDVVTFKFLETLFQRILNIAITLAGLVLFIMLLKAGFDFLTSAGDPEKVKKAGATLTWAVIGFIMLILSWFILRLIEQFTGVTLTKFELLGI